MKIGQMTVILGQMPGMSKRKTKAGEKRKQPVTYKTVEETESENELNEPGAVYGISASGGNIAVLKYLGGSSVLQQGIKAIQSFQDFIALIRKGISRRSLDHLMRITGISTDEMAAIMHTSGRTLRRYNADTLLNPEQSERVFELARLYSRGEEVFGDIELFKNWMEDHVPALGNKKPKEFLDTSLGIDVLMDELGRIEQGIYA